MIVDATNLIIGRLSSLVAKKALQGEKIDIVNCENAVITGSRQEVFAKYRQRRARSTIFKGPHAPRMPDRFTRRVIRGMLPYKQEKGRKAFERVMCYIGVPRELEGKKTETFAIADAEKRKVMNFVKVSELCKELGAKI